ncbi:MAG: hypothetical protein JJU11_07180 [Candidatus Sumerlaeia bacterium]|nr:hypothetical protein [Candidatus Sumerlaeia bacterium]
MQFMVNNLKREVETFHELRRKISQYEALVQRKQRLERELGSLETELRRRTAAYQRATRSKEDFESNTAYMSFNFFDPTSNREMNFSYSRNRDGSIANFRNQTVARMDSLLYTASQEINRRESRISEVTGTLKSNSMMTAERERNFARSLHREKHGKLSNIHTSLLSELENLPHVDKTLMKAGGEFTLLAPVGDYTVVTYYIDDFEEPTLYFWAHPITPMDFQREVVLSQGNLMAKVPSSNRLITSGWD